MKAAAMARNHDFIVKDIVKRNKKKMLKAGQDRAYVNERLNTHKNCSAERWRPTIKYKRTEKTIMMTRVMGTSTRVWASASTNGWYNAAFSCRRTISRCEYNDGISDMVANAENKSELRVA